jgi:hypothetical protein
VDAHANINASHRDQKRRSNTYAKYIDIKYQVLKLLLIGICDKLANTLGQIVILLGTFWVTTICGGYIYTVKRFEHSFFRRLRSLAPGLLPAGPDKHTSMPDD